MPEASIKNSSLPRFLLMAIVAAHALLLEDSYGYWYSEPSFAYRQMSGVSVITLLYVMLFLLMPIRLKPRIPKGSLWLGLLLIISLLVSLLYSVVSGGLLSGAGTGLLEVRVGAVMVLIYFVLSNYLARYSVRSLLSAVLMIGTISIGFYFIVYITGTSLLYTAVDQYGRSIAFEGGLLTFWDICFCYCLAVGLLMGRRRGYLLLCLGFGLCEILSFRRSFILQLIGGGVTIFLAISSRSVVQSLKRWWVVIIIAFVIAGYVRLRQPELLGRISPAGFLDSSSEAYSKSYSSNVGHLSDLKVGLALVRNHYLFGIGLGEPFFSDPSAGIDSSILHSEQLHTWLRLGLLGLVTLLFFYILMWWRALYVLRQSVSSSSRTVALMVLAVTLPQFILSAVGPPFYLQQKPEFLFTLMFVALEVTYLNERQKKMPKIIEASKARLMLSEKDWQARCILERNPGP